MRSILFISLFAAFATNLYCQNTGNLPQKSIETVLNEMINCKEEKYQLNNVEIVFGEGYFDSLLNIYKTKPTVKAYVEIGSYYGTNIRTRIVEQQYGVNYSYLWFENFTFEEAVSVFAAEFRSIDLDNCTFKKHVYIKGGNTKFDVYMNNCNFYDRVHLDVASTEKSSITINNSKFNFQGIELNAISYIEGNTNTKLSIYKSYFGSSMPEKSMISVLNGLYSLSIDSCFFNNDISLNQVNIANSFSIQSSVLRNISLIDCVLPPSSGFSIPWNQLSEKLCMLYEETKKFKLKDDEITAYGKAKIYKGNTREEINDSRKFEKLIASYYNILSIYKQRGNLESGNACYIEVKDFQTKRMEYVYQNNRTISSFFLWKTNQFLRYFCDYGTNPAKSVVISFYVILIFGGFYFFFYSAWDRINKKYFLNKYSALSKYLSSKTTLYEFYHTANTRDIQTYHDFKNEVTQKKKEVPGYVTFLGHVLYRYSTSRYNLAAWVTKKMDVQKGLWKDQSAGKKFLIGSVIGVSILAFLIYTAVVKSLSATILSLNAFSTLGFGNIPVKGLSKYLTVIEGFLGWLLLSIFSVSLIAQMIQ